MDNLVASIHQLHNSPDWNFLSVKQDVSIYCRRPYSSSQQQQQAVGQSGSLISQSSSSSASSAVQPPLCCVDQIKGCVLIPAPLSEVLAHVLNPVRKRSKKDPVFENYVIEEDRQKDIVRRCGTEVGQVIYRAQKMPWPLQVRYY